MSATFGKETLENATPLVRNKSRVVDVVFSPDDGGYYLHDYDLVGNRDRVSKKVWAVRADAERSYKIGTVKWESWSS